MLAFKKSIKISFIFLLFFVFSLLNYRIVKAALSCTDDDEDGICVSISSPRGSETFNVGDKIKIQWVQNNIDMITIGYKTCDSCLDWIVNNLKVDPAQTEQNYEWTIPQNLAGKSNVTIEIIAYKTGYAQDVVYSNSFNIKSTSTNIPTEIIPTTPSQTITNPSELPKQDAYKAIVKIKSFTLNEGYFLTKYSEGSGIIISSNGIILTNYHVVTLENDFDNSEYESSYQICLPQSINKEPNCSYTAKLISKNKDLDVALLQIQNISGLSNLNIFPYLELNQTDNTKTNDEVIALGYPEIGGDTITITKGIVSGKMDKYNKKWIKTDAVMSFGSSGGAAIDSTGKLIGITSELYSDLAGSMGYIINIISINDWIASNKNKTPQTSQLIDRVADITKKQKAIESSNKFENDYPAYSITKPTDWDFDYSQEDGFYIEKNSDKDGGSVMVALIDLPYLATLDNVVPAIYRINNLVGMLSLITITKNQDVTVNGHKGKLINISLFGSTKNYYFFPEREYLIEILYDYGKNDKDKDIINTIINSFIMVDSNKPFDEIHKYSSSAPTFNISTNNDWAILKNNSKKYLIYILNKKIKEAYVSLEIEKTDENTKGLDNEGYLNYRNQQIKELNQIGNRIDYKLETIKTDAHYKLNAKITDVIKIEYVEKSISSGNVLAYNTDYLIKIADKYLGINLTVYSNNKDIYNKALTEFNSLLQSLSLIAGTSVNININNTNTKISDMNNRLKGKIILKVQSKGEAYYINPTKLTMHSLGRPNDAFQVMREQGVGITNSNLAKISVGLSNLSGTDTDKDGLPDIFEDAIGTNKNKADTDGDGYNDKEELSNGYSPVIKLAKLSSDNNFTNTQKGKIFLQVEGKGEAWYINPADGKRYFLGRPQDAFNIMRNLGLGISNSDFDKLK